MLLHNNVHKELCADFPAIKFWVRKWDFRSVLSVPLTQSELNVRLILGVLQCCLQLF